MRESGALRISDEGKVLHKVGYGGRRPIDGTRRSSDMLKTLLTWLNEVAKVCYAEGVKVGILGSNSALPSVRALTLQAVILLEAAESWIIASRAS